MKKASHALAFFFELNLMQNGLKNRALFCEFCSAFFLWILQFSIYMDKEILIKLNLRIAIALGIWLRPPKQ